MAKHFNEKHDCIISTRFNDIKEKGIIYREGDAIQQKEVAQHARYITYVNDRLEIIYLHRELILDLYTQITEIEKNTIIGQYSELPF